MKQPLNKTSAAILLFQKHTTVKYVCLFIMAFVLFTSCKKDYTIEPGPGTYFQWESKPNLLLNADFLEADTSTTLPAHWKMQQIYNNAAVFTRTPQGLHMESNSQGEHYLYQVIAVERGKNYKVTADVSYSINNYYTGGIYAFNLITGNIMGKCEQAKSEGKEKMAFIFNSRDLDSVKIVLGFLNGMNATFDCHFIEVMEQPVIKQLSITRLSRYLNDKLKLKFDSVNYRTSISGICNYLNGVLQCQIRNKPDYKNEPSKLMSLIYGREADYVYLTTYLNDLQHSNNAYCQRSTLCLEEILNNEFNIPTRSIYVNNEEYIGIHQFLEYWNPYIRRWVIIDPYFSTRYADNGTLIGSRQLANISDPWNKMIPFGKNAFSSSIEELEEIWGMKLDLEVQPTYLLSFPFQDRVRPPVKPIRGKTK